MESTQRAAVAGCVNLWTRYGGRFKVTADPAYDTANVPRTKLDPWYFQIPHRYGYFYPHGGNRLAVTVDHHNRIAAMVQRLPGVEVWLDGDQEKTFLFHVDQFEEVAAIVKPRKRPALSDQDRQRRRERMSRLHSMATDAVK